MATTRKEPAKEVTKNVGGAQREARWDLEEYERKARERAENGGEDPDRGDVDDRPCAIERSSRKQKRG